MGIFSRFMDIVNSNINSILDKAEDPEKMLRLMIQEMEDTLIELKSSCAGLMADAIRQEKTLAETEKAIQRWQNRAVLAVEKGREDLAREALIEKKKFVEELEAKKDTLLSMTKQADNAKEEIAQLEDKLTDAKRRLKALKEKELEAERERQANQRRSMNLNSKFDAMEERIDRQSAWNEVQKPGKSAEDKFAELEAEDEIDRELEALRKELGK